MGAQAALQSAPPTSTVPWPSSSRSGSDQQDTSTMIILARWAQGLHWLCFVAERGEVTAPAHDPLEKHAVAAGFARRAGPLTLTASSWKCPKPPEGDCSEAQCCQNTIWRQTREVAFNNMKLPKAFALGSK